MKLTPEDLAEIRAVCKNGGFLQINEVEVLLDHIAAIELERFDVEGLCAAVLDGTVEDEMRYAAVNLGNVIDNTRAHCAESNPWRDVKDCSPPLLPGSTYSAEVDVCNDSELTGIEFFDCEAPQLFLRWTHWRPIREGQS